MDDEGRFHVHLVNPVYRPCSMCEINTLKSANGDDHPQILTIAKQLLRGLDAMHRAMVIHGDLKPGNILVDDSSAIGDIKVVISDFAAGVIVDVAPGSPQSFSTTRFALDEICPTTYRYRAVELFMSKRNRRITFATDVWAMGVVLVEIVDNSVPFGRLGDNGQYCDVFEEALNILYKMKEKTFSEFVRDDHVMFYNQLAKCELVDEVELPWAKERPLAFKKFLRSFFVADPRKRPPASKLVLDVALDVIRC